MIPSTRYFHSESNIKCKYAVWTVKLGRFSFEINLKIKDMKIQFCFSVFALIATLTMLINAYHTVVYAKEAALIFHTVLVILSFFLVFTSIPKKWIRKKN